MKLRQAFLTLSVPAFLAGCVSSPTSADTAALSTPASRTAPPPCAANFAQRAGTLTLANTLPPKDLVDNKSAPQQFANTINVGKPLKDLARASRYDNGWTSFALAVQSRGAQSISVHISSASMPRNGEIWLCSPDGLRSEGPYRDPVGGDVWTPVVPGEVAWLEVLVPTAQAGSFKATLAEVFGGFK
jgi:hypothetical protein